MVLERIKKLALEKGFTIAKIESSLGFGNGIIGKWKTQDPSAKKLLMVADFLNTSVDYLLTGEQTSSNLTDNEQKIVEIVNCVGDSREQLMLIGVADNYAKSLPSYIPSTKNSYDEGADAQQRLGKTS